MTVRRRLGCDDFPAFTGQVQLAAPLDKALADGLAFVLKRWQRGDRAVYLLDRDAEAAILGGQEGRPTQDLLREAIGVRRWTPFYLAPLEAPWSLVDRDGDVRDGQEVDGYVVDVLSHGEGVPSTLLICPIVLDGGKINIAEPIACFEAEDGTGWKCSATDPPIQQVTMTVIARLAAIAERRVVHPVLEQDRRGTREHAHGAVSRHRYHVLRVVDCGRATLERGEPLPRHGARLGAGIRMGPPPAPPRLHVVHEHPHGRWVREPAPGESVWGECVNLSGGTLRLVIRPTRQHERGAGPRVEHEWRVRA